MQILQEFDWNLNSLSLCLYSFEEQMHNNQQEMMPRPQKSLGNLPSNPVCRRGNFKISFKSPFAPRRPPIYLAESFHHQKRPYYQISCPNDNSYSPYTYKSPQYKDQKHSSSKTYSSPTAFLEKNCSNHSGLQSRPCMKNFNVNEYVIPDMTTNPWKMLEESLDGELNKESC
ncbi:unnamed protein product [Thelazia callipaeda]|uniref:Chromosome 1 open reading frame 94 n=1 Tax=Thelazia callipaeda TaxID=103827 RepID=A0A0N5CXA2_THECL|nr:unnamed protein product [Thelazia callipaeda]